MAPNPLFAWGNGHDYVSRDALVIMPPAIKNFIGKANQQNLVKWCHAPDSFVPLAKEQQKYPLTAAEIKYLHSFGQDNLYSLHDDRSPGEVGNFILLIKAFIAKDPARSTLWMSTILHTIADDVACNHTSQIHYLTYGIAPLKVKIGQGIGFDYADVARTTAGKKIIKELLAKYRPQPLTGTPEKIVMNILTTNAQAATYGTQRERAIIATYAPKADAVVRQRGMTAMAELGVYGAEKAMNIIITAWNFAQKGTIPKFTPAMVKLAKRQRAQYFASRPLSDDSIYNGLLQPSSENGKYVGILLERSSMKMHSKLSFGGRLILAAAMRNLQTAKIPYCTVDLRQLNQPNAPVLDVKKIPLLVLCSGSYHPSNTAKANLKRYFAAGGRLLWIGGRDQGIMGALSQSLTKADPKILPVTKKYGQNNLKVIDKITLKFLPPFNRLLGNNEYKFINNPDTTAGSQQPWCLLKIVPVNQLVKPLVQLSVGKQTISVAAALTNKTGQVEAIFLPEYILAPFVLADPGSQPVNVAAIKLDKVGAAIFLQSIGLLLNKNNDKRKL